MKDSDDINLKKFLSETKTNLNKKRSKKFKIIEKSELISSNFEEKSKIEIFSTLKREPVTDLSKELNNIEDEIMQNNMQMKHNSYKKDNVFMDQLSLNENFARASAPIFKTKKILHKKIENGISQTMHCVKCKCIMPFSTNDLKCIECMYYTFNLEIVI